MFSRQQTQMKFYRASLVLCWCPPRRSAAHWAVNCCFSRLEVTAVVTSYNACQDFASAPIPKISTPCVSWISHDPERPALVVGPWLFCVHSLPHLSLSHPLQMLQWLFFLPSRPTTPIRGHSATSFFLLKMFLTKPELHPPICCLFLAVSLFLWIPWVCWAAVLSVALLNLSEFGVNTVRSDRQLAHCCHLMWAKQINDFAVTEKEEGVLPPAGI